MEDRVFRDAGEDALHFRGLQVSRYTHIYSISLQVPMSVSATIPVYVEPILQVMEDADFWITHVTGSVQSPVDANGVRIESTSAMTLSFPMAGSPNRPDRGISFKLFDPKTNRRLSEGQVTTNAVHLAALASAGSQIDRTFLQAADVFSPGYGSRLGHTKFEKPYDGMNGAGIPFEYYLARGERLKVRIQSTSIYSSESVYYERVSLAFIGNRYDT